MLSPARRETSARRCRYRPVVCLSLVVLLASSCATAERGGDEVAGGKQPAGAADANMNGSTSGSTDLRAEKVDDYARGDTESYGRIDENPFLEVARAALDLLD